MFNKIHFRLFSLILAGLLFLGSSVESLGAPFFYLATDKSFGQNETPYVNLEGPGNVDYEVRIYRLDKPEEFLTKTVKERLVQEKNNEVYGNAFNISKNTWRKFKADFRDIAREELNSNTRSEIVRSLAVDFSDKDELDIEALPGYLKQYKFITAFNIPSDDKEWNYRRVTIPVKENGVYLIEGVSGNNLGYTLIVKSNINFVVKQSDNETLVYGAYKDSGSPVNTAQLKVLDNNSGAVLFNGVTGKDGALLLKNKSSSKSLIVLNKDGEYAISDPNFFASSFYGSGGVRVFMYTDRPIYRPGDQVYFKGIVRNFRKDDYEIQSGGATVDVLNNNGDPVQTGIPVDVNSESGTFNGEFTLPSDTAVTLGTYLLLFKFASGSYTTEFSVDAYKKPTFLVKVNTPKNVYVKNEKVPVTVNARFYYGKPVAGANVRYRVFRRPKFDFSPVGALPFFAEAAEYLGMSRIGGNNELVVEDKGELDKNGSISFDIEPSKINQDYVYSVLASVTSDDNTIDGAGSFSVNRSAFYIRVLKDNSVYEPGDTIKIKAELKAFDPALTPEARKAEIAGRKVKATLYSRSFVGISQEGERKELEDQSMVTNENGVAEFSFKIKKGGHYNFNFEADDSNGETTTADSPLWVSAQNDSIQVSTRNLTITSGKDLYEAGDMAEILIVSPVADGNLFITIEGNYIYQYESVKLKGNSLKYKVRVSSALTPNFTVSATQFANNEIYKNQIKVVAPPLEKFLQVKVTPGKGLYLPGEKAEISIDTLDFKNKGVSAEVSVALVDEAIFQLQEDKNPSINVYFYHPRTNNVATTYSAAYRFFGYSEETRLQLALQSKGVPPLALMKEDKQKGRERFKDTGYWSARVKTDSNGKAKLVVDLPENITTWRITAIAVTRDTRVGQSKAEFIARKDLMLNPGLPAYLLRGQKQIVSANLTNLTGESANLKVTARVANGKVDGNAEQTLTLDAGKSVQSYFTIIPSADENIDKCSVELFAKSDKLSDGIKQTIPIKNSGVYRTESATLVLSDAVPTRDGSIKIPERGAKMALSLWVTPGAGSALRQSLSYLADYPYGCIEQTMSRFMPLLAAKQTGFITPRLANEMNKMVDTGLYLIKQHQKSDGGFAWFGDELSNPMMTAYVYRGLIICDKLTGKKNEDNITSARYYLSSSISAGNLTRFEKYYVMYALSENNRLDKSLADKITTESVKETLYTKALGVLILQRLGRTDDARNMFNRLVTETSWINNPEYRFPVNTSENWENDQVETAAALLTAAVRLRVSQSIIDNLTSILLVNRSEMAWKNSRDTSMAVLALSEALQLSRQIEGDCTIDVTVNDVACAQVTLTQAQIESGNTKINISDAQLKTGINKIALTKKSGSSLKTNAVIDFYDRSDRFKSSNNGISIERNYYKMEGRESDDGMVFDASKGSSFKTGDLVMVELQVDLKGERVSYLMIEDQLPPGFSVIRDDSTYFTDDFTKEYSEKQAFDDRVVLLGSLLSSSSVLRYFIRAELPGEYRALPARAQQMYFPQINGTTVDQNLSIYK